MSRWTLALAVAIGALATVGMPRTASSKDPSVKKLGNAIVEYRDDNIHAVAAYEYSHRHHDEAWLFLDVAFTTKERLTFHREDFRITASEGSIIPAATQNRFIDDAAVISKIRQNAKVWTRDLGSYFTERPAAGFRMFALPGDGIVSDDLVTDENGPARVTLYFRSPDGKWREGSYTFTIDNGHARAELPIALR